MRFSALAAPVCAAISLTVQGPVHAQTSQLPYREKTVWTISYVETKPGMFYDYMRDLSNVWRKYVNKMKADGIVLSYKILNLPFARDKEPDLILLVEYKDMAAFDKGPEYMESLFNEISGSLNQANKASIDREKLRELRGTILTREIDFQD